MRLRTAFILGLLAVIGVMAVPALFGVKYVRDVRQIALDLRQRTAEAAFKVGRIQIELERFERFQRAYVATGDPGLAERSRRALAVVDTDISELRASGYGDAVDTASPLVDQLSVVATLTGLLMESGLRDEATVLLREDLAPLLVHAGETAEALAVAVDATTEARLRNVDRITARAVRTTTLSLLLALVTAGILTLLAARVLTRPLNRLRESMARVADGHFDPPRDLPYERRDEIGELFRAFRSMALRLADLDRMKAELVGIASHDLQNPVNVVSGYVELLAEEVGPDLEDRQREVLDALLRQTQKLSSRVNQLLEISRIQASGLRLGLEEINVRHFVSALERAYGRIGDRHGIEVSATVDESAPTFLLADPDTLRSDVFGNLLDSALKYTPQGGRVRLTASGRGGTVTFEVADQGPGIPTDELPHVFDRYYRGRDTSGRLGAGLGLPIARAAVEAHGGSIDVESPPDGGAVFRLTLPIHPTIPALYGEEQHG